MHYTRNTVIPRKYTKFLLTPLTAEVEESGVTDLLLTLRE